MYTHCCDTMVPTPVTELSKDSKNICPDAESSAFIYRSTTKVTTDQMDLKLNINQDTSFQHNNFHFLRTRSPFSVPHQFTEQS